MQVSLSSYLVCNPDRPSAYDAMFTDPGEAVEYLWRVNKQMNCAFVLKLLVHTPKRTVSGKFDGISTVDFPALYITDSAVAFGTADGAQIEIWI